MIDLNKIKQTAFNDELQKIAGDKKPESAFHQSLSRYGRDALGALAGSVGGGAAGLGLGAGVGALLKHPQEGAALGSVLGMSGAGAAGAIYGDKSFVKSRTGKSISTKDVILANFKHAIPGVAASSAGSLATLALMKSHPKAAIAANLLGTAGGFGLGIRGYHKATQEMLKKNS